MYVATAPSKNYYITQKSLLKEIILYRKMFYSFLVNNFHELLRNNNNSINKNNKFVFEIYTLGQNFVKIINLYLPFFYRKIAWSYSATDTLSTKSPTRAIPKTNTDNAPMQYPRYHIIILWPCIHWEYGLLWKNFFGKKTQSNLPKK